MRITNGRVDFFVARPLSLYEGWGSASKIKIGADPHLGDNQIDLLWPVPEWPTDINDDGSINVLDVIELLLCFGDPALPPCDTGTDINRDGFTNVLDLIQLLLAFGRSWP